jgi:DNA-binding GntR family transcriptional regulator
MSQPRYLALAGELARAIAKGRHPVGTQLPTETDLCAAHGVSRFTVRAALKSLQEQGYVTRRQGSGTQVVAAAPGAGYMQQLGSIEDILQYARDTRLELGPPERVRARGALAELLGCASGREWLAFSGLRRPARGATAICTTEIWLDAAFAALAPKIGKRRQAINQLVEQAFGHPTVEIRQEISATVLDATQAAWLGAAVDQPALRVLRRYLGPGGRVFEASVSVHPADRFAYAMRLRREGG